MIGKWEKIKNEEIYRCGTWYKVEKDKVKSPGGNIVNYYKIKSDKPSVVIIPIDKYGNLYLTKQHRYTINEFSLEFPAGWIDKKDKNILSAAKRELKEEVNLSSKKWKILGEHTQAIGISNLKIHIVLAQNCQKNNSNFKKDFLDKNLHENIILKYKELKNLIAKSKIQDSVTLCAFAIAEAQGLFNKHKNSL